MSNWYLEGYFSNDETMQQLHIVNLPQVLGRDQNLAMTISGPSISRNHAKLELIDGAIHINDLQSSNGTFVNRQKISSATPLKHGDVIHLGITEMRLIDRSHSTLTSRSEDDGQSEHTHVMSVTSLSNKFPSGIQELERLIQEKAVAMVFQPIIDAKTKQSCGYEVLGRGASTELPPSPLAIFSIAESFNLEVTLSELMRNEGIDIAAAHKLRGDILVNTHPSELKNIDRLLADLQSMRRRHHTLPVTLEIHEQAVTENKSEMQAFSDSLSKMNIKLAFDDFGVGQSRLMELVDAKPNLIKFDKVLIENIDSGDTSRYNLLKHLKDLASDLGITTLAECVSSEGEYKVCEEMGFELYQGFYFAKPQPADNFINVNPQG